MIKRDAAAIGMQTGVPYAFLAQLRRGRGCSEGKLACRRKAARTLNLPRLRIVLLELDLVKGNDFTSSVEDKEAGAGGTLINGTDKRRGRHGFWSFASLVQRAGNKLIEHSEGRR